MASTDARPVPQKNVAFRITFPILDADGDLVTGAAGLDSEVSKDGGTFADCTNEATEIATSSGMYYLDLTSTEMNADTVAVIVKTSTVGAKTTTLVMYPEEAGDIRVNVTQFGGTNGTFASGRPEVNTTHAAGTAWGSGAITAASIAADAITAAKVAADVHAEAADAVWDEDATGHQTTGTFGQAIGDPVADTNTIYGAVVTGAAGATIAADIIAVKAETAAILDDTDLIDDATSGLAKIATDVAAVLVDTGTTLQAELDGIQADTEDIQSKIGTPAGVSVSADIAAVKSDTAAILSDTGTDGVVVSAASVRTAVGLASANLDTQIGDLPTNAELTTALGTADDATLAAIAALSIPTANANADALLDRADAIETGLTLRGAVRLNTAALAGKVSGAGSGTEVFRNAVADSKARITSTVDADGNRTAVTADAT